jgi:FkbM family methyltransferase
MKLVYDYWMPDSDCHFERLIAKRIKQGGPAEYQDDVRAAAYQYVSDYNLCLDIGANVGLWAKPLSKKFNKVIAFEPLEQVYQCLEKNVQGLHVEVRKHALGSINGLIDMVFDSENTGASYVNEKSNKLGTIEIKRLDDLNLPKFGLVKIDCERHELEILRGSTETILKYKPIVIVEQHPDTAYCAGSYLKSIGAVEITNIRKDYIFGW